MRRTRRRRNSGIPYTAEQLYQPALLDKYDAVGFTSHGVVANGKLVSGRGSALDVNRCFPSVSAAIGRMIQPTSKARNKKYEHNRVVAVQIDPSEALGTCAGIKTPLIVFNFPTQKNFKNPATLQLIAQSAKELAELADKGGWKNVALPFPGLSQVEGALNKAEVQKALAPLQKSKTSFHLYEPSDSKRTKEEYDQGQAEKAVRRQGGVIPTATTPYAQDRLERLKQEKDDKHPVFGITILGDKDRSKAGFQSAERLVELLSQQFLEDPAPQIKQIIEKAGGSVVLWTGTNPVENRLAQKAGEMGFRIGQAEGGQRTGLIEQADVVYLLPSEGSGVTEVLSGTNAAPTTEMQWDAATALNKSPSLRAVLDQEVFTSYQWNKKNRRWEPQYSEGGESTQEDKRSVPMPPSQSSLQQTVTPKKSTPKKSAPKQKDTKKKAFFDLIVFGAPPSVGKDGLKVPLDVTPAFFSEYKTLSATIGNKINEQPATKDWKRFPMVTVTVPNLEGVPHTFMNLPVRKSAGTQPDYDSVMIALNRLEKKIRAINKEKKVIKKIGIMFDSSSFLGLSKLKDDKQEKKAIQRRIAKIAVDTGVNFFYIPNDNRTSSPLEATAIGKAAEISTAFKKRKPSKEKEFKFTVQLDNTFNPLNRVGGCENEPRTVILNAWGYADVKMYIDKYLAQLESPALRDWTGKCIEAWCDNKPQAWVETQSGPALQPGIDQHFPDFISFVGNEQTDNGRPYQTYGSMLVINDEASQRDGFNIDSCLRIVIVSQRDTYFEWDGGRDREWSNMADDSIYDMSVHTHLTKNQYADKMWKRMKLYLDIVFQIERDKLPLAEVYYMGDRNQTPFGDTYKQTVMYEIVPPDYVFRYLVRRGTPDQVKMINLDVSESKNKFAGYPIVRESQLKTQGIQGVTGKLRNLFLLGTQDQLKTEGGDYLSPIMGKRNPKTLTDDEQWYEEREEIISKFSPRNPIYYYTPVFAAHQVYEFQDNKLKGRDRFEFVYGEKSGKQLKLQSITRPLKDLGKQQEAGKQRLSFPGRVEQMYYGNYTSPSLKESQQFNGNNYLNKQQKESKRVWEDDKLYTTLEVLNYTEKAYREVARIAAFAPIKPFYTFPDSPRFEQGGGRNAEIRFDSQLKFQMIKESFESIMRQKEGDVRSVISIDWTELNVNSNDAYLFVSYSGKTYVKRGLDALLEILKSTFLKTYNIDVFIYNVPNLQDAQTVGTAKSIELIQEEQQGDVYAEEIASDSYTGVAGYVGVLGKHESAYPFVIGDFPSFYLQSQGFQQSSLYSVLYPEGKAQRLSLLKNVKGLNKDDIFEGQSLAMSNVRNLLRNYVISRSVVLRNLSFYGDKSPFVEGMSEWEKYFAKWKRYAYQKELIKGSVRPHRWHLDNLLEKYEDAYRKIESQIVLPRNGFWTKWRKSPHAKWSKLLALGTSDGDGEVLTSIEEQLWDYPEYAAKAYDIKIKTLRIIQKQVESELATRRAKSLTSGYARNLKLRLENLSATLSTQLKQATKAYNEALEEEKVVEKYNQAKARGEISELDKPLRPQGEVPSLILYGINQDGSYFKVNTKSDTGKSSVFVPHYWPTDPFDKLNVAILSLLEEKEDEVRIVQVAKGFAYNPDDLLVLNSPRVKYTNKQIVAARILIPVLEKRGKNEDAGVLRKYEQALLKGEKGYRKDVERVVQKEFGSGSLGGQIEAQIQYLKTVKKDLVDEGYAIYDNGVFKMGVEKYWYTLPKYKEYMEKKGRLVLGAIQEQFEKLSKKEEYDCILAPSVSPGNWNIPVENRAYEDVMIAQSGVSTSYIDELPAFTAEVDLPEFDTPPVTQTPAPTAPIPPTLEEEVAFNVYDSVCILAQVQLGALKGKEKALVFRGLLNQLAAMTSEGGWPALYSGKDLVENTFSYDWSTFNKYWIALANKYQNPKIKKSPVAVNTLDFIQVGSGKTLKEMTKNILSNLPYVKGIDSRKLELLTTRLEGYLKWGQRYGRKSLPSEDWKKVSRIRPEDVALAVNYLFAQDDSRTYLSTVEIGITVSDIQEDIRDLTGEPAKLEQYDGWLRNHGEGGLSKQGTWVIYTADQIRDNIFKKKGKLNPVAEKHLDVLNTVIYAANRIILPVYRQQICGVK